MVFGNYTVEESAHSTRCQLLPIKIALITTNRISSILNVYQSSYFIELPINKAAHLIAICRCCVACLLIIIIVLSLFIQTPQFLSPQFSGVLSKDNRARGNIGCILNSQQYTDRTSMSPNSVPMQA